MKATAHRLWIASWAVLGAGILYILLPRDGFTPPQHDQRRIVSAALAIRKAEAEFLRAQGRFGTLPEIRPILQDIVVARDGSGEQVNGFRIELEATTSQYRLFLARPREMSPRTAQWTLYMDEGGELRLKFGAPPASAAAPPMSAGDLAETLEAIQRSR